jgi:hypothetical protein
MKNLFLAICCGLVLVACNKPKEEATSTPAEAVAPPPTEIGDAKYVEIGKKGIQQLSSNDIDGWMSSFADNARYYWSGGDSVVGKKALTDYWKDRRGNVIESITFKNNIWTPLKVNVPQNSKDLAGPWLLSWYEVSVTYKKNHQSLKFWVHTDFHFDASDKIDVVVQYIDRAPIIAAMAKK